MNITREDTSAGMPPQTSRYQPGYDCPLPQSARTELLASKRGRPPAPPQKRSWLDSMRSWWHAAMLGLLGLVFIAALCSILSWSASKHATVPVLAPAPAVQPTPAVPTPTTEVRRAEPVPVTVRRAEVVRFPLVRTTTTDFTELSPEHIDEMHGITMPYGERVNATLRGFLEQENQLPRVGRVGDMYIVGTVPWIWIVAPGASHADWIDP